MNYLRHSPNVGLFGELLGVSTSDAFVMVVSLLRWCVENTDGNDLRPIGAGTLAAVVRYPDAGRFWDALESSGWIENLYFIDHLDLYPPPSPGVRPDFEEWLGIRERVLRRDDHQCVSCGSRWKLQVDHIKPLKMGGSNRDKNLQTLCEDCHKLKTSSDLSQIAQRKREARLLVNVPSKAEIAEITRIADERHKSAELRAADAFIERILTEESND